MGNVTSDTRIDCAVCITPSVKKSSGGSTIRLLSKIASARFRENEEDGEEGSKAEQHLATEGMVTQTILRRPRQKMNFWAT